MVNEPTQRELTQDGFLCDELPRFAATWARPGIYRRGLHRYHLILAPNQPQAVDGRLFGRHALLKFFGF